MTPCIKKLERVPTFDREFKSAPPEVRQDAADILRALLKWPHPKSLRMHRLKGFSHPSIWKVDVHSNHSWQITFTIEGETATLRRIATHKQIDRRP